MTAANIEKSWLVQLAMRPGVCNRTPYRADRHRLEPWTIPSRARPLVRAALPFDCLHCCRHAELTLPSAGASWSRPRCSVAQAHPQPDLEHLPPWPRHGIAALGRLDL